MQSRMLSSPPKSMTTRSMPNAIPPWGGAPNCRASSRKPNRSRAVDGIDPQQVEDLLLGLGIVNSDRASTRFVAVDHQIVGLSAALARIGVEQRDVLRARRRERMVHRTPPLLFLVELEHRELDDPREVHLPRIVELQFGTQPFPQAIQRLAGHFPRVGHEQQHVARLQPPSARAIRSSIDSG